VLVVGIVKRTLNRGLLELRRRRAQARLAAQRTCVAGILASKEPPLCSGAEAAFEDLQAKYTGVPEYGYDPYSTWRRGTERALVLMKLVARLETPGARILETACGDAMTGFVLSGFGHDVTLSDLEDWRDSRARALTFTTCDVCRQLPFGDEQFDVCVTYNSFEHLNDPEGALAEMIRVLRPGGWLFTDFGPLYAGPWGLHAYRTLRMPYPQFLFSESFWRAKLRELGIRDLNRVMDDLQPLNRWSVAKFRELWRNSGCEVGEYTELSAQSELDMIERFPTSFQGRGLTVEDVSTHGVKALLRKRG
jgi:SAM-dependent methyltransferase